MRAVHPSSVVGGSRTRPCCLATAAGTLAEAPIACVVGASGSVVAPAAFCAAELTCACCCAATSGTYGPLRQSHGHCPRKRGLGCTSQTVLERGGCVCLSPLLSEGVVLPVPSSAAANDGAGAVVETAGAVSREARTCSGRVPLRATRCGLSIPSSVVGGTNSSSDATRLLWRKRGVAKGVAYSARSPPGCPVSPMGD